MTETFDIPPELPTVKQQETRGVTEDPRGGAVHRKALWNGKNLERIDYTVTWKKLNEGGAVRLKQLWALTLNGSLSMWWTPPDRGIALYRFLDEELTITQLSGPYYAAQVRLGLVF